MKPITLVALTLLPLTGRAAPRTFTGNGADTNWNTTANWTPAGGPAAADNLIFIAGAISSNNNLSAATFHDFDFNARHTLSGNAFTLTHGLTASAVLGITINPNITLGENQTFDVSSGSLTCAGTLALNQKVLTATGAGTLVLATVTGSGVSQVVKNGTGTLRISTIAANAAGIDVNDGTLDVAGIVTGPVTLDSGRLIGNGQCQGVVTSTGGEIVPTGGDLAFANTLTLSSTTKVIVSLTGPGAENHVTVSGGAVNLNNAELVIDISAYQPVWNEDFTLLSKSTTGLVSGRFKNLDQGDEIRLNATTIGRISYTGGNGNEVVLDIISTTRTWDGGHTVNDNWDQPENWTNNIRPNFGDVVVFPSGIQSSDRGVDNNFPDDTTFRQLVFNGDDFTVRGNPFKLSHGITLGIASGQINLDTSLTLAQNQTLDFGSASLTSASLVLHFDPLDDIDTAGRILTLRGRGTLAGTIVGAGGLVVPEGNDHSIALPQRNTYDGETVIGPGAYVNIQHEDSLGSTTGRTVLSGTMGYGTENIFTTPFKLREPLLLQDGCLLQANHRVAGGERPTEILGPVELAGHVIFQGRGHDVDEFSGVISGIGILEFDRGGAALKGTSANTFSGSMRITSRTSSAHKSAPGILAIPCAELFIGGDLSRESRLILAESEQIANQCHVHVENMGLLMLGDSDAVTETIGELTVTRGGIVEAEPDSLLKITGNISCIDSAANINPRVDVDIMVQGTPCVIHTPQSTQLDLRYDLSRSGAASVRKTGSGFLSLGDTVVAVPLELTAGNTSVFRASSSPVRLNGGGLSLKPGGDGTGAVTSEAGGGAIHASNRTFPVQSLSLNAATQMTLSINPNNAGQFVVAGDVNLNGAALVLTLPPPDQPQIPLGTQVRILDKTSPGAIEGTFAGLPEGAGAFFGNAAFTITYRGGSGANDVVLTSVTLQPRVTSMTLSEGTGPGGVDEVTVIGIAPPSLANLLERSSDLVNWTSVSGSGSSSAGEVNVTILLNPSITPRFFVRFRP